MMARIIYHRIEPEARNNLYVHFKEFENMIICFPSQLFLNIIPLHFCIDGIFFFDLAAVQEPLHHPVYFYQRAEYI